MKTYAKNISNRKDLVKKLEQLTGQHAVYTFMPKCAYEIGAFTVNKDGTLTVQDDADSSIIERLAADGMIGGEIIAEESTGTVSEAATAICAKQSYTVYNGKGNQAKNKKSGGKHHVDTGHDQLQRESIPLQRKALRGAQRIRIR